MSQKRSEILDKVLALLHMRSDEKFTMKNVADQLGLSKSTLYEYFPNKATMITDAILQMMQENQATINEDEATEHLGFNEHLKTHLQRLMNLVEKNRLMQQLMYHPEVSMLPPVMKLRVFNQLQSTKHKMTERLHFIFEKGIKEKSIEAPIDPWKEKMIESMILGVMMERSNPDNDWVTEDVLNHLNETILELMIKKR
jgi:AcrR family transcriptional regulator